MNKIKIAVVVTFTYYHCRRLKNEQSIKGELNAPDSAIGAVANVQVNPQQEVDMNWQVLHKILARPRPSIISNIPTKQSARIAFGSFTLVPQNDETFPIRFVHLSVLWLVINTRLIQLC